MELGVLVDLGVDDRPTRKAGTTQTNLERFEISENWTAK